jgi:hypothetical protein
MTRFQIYFTESRVCELFPGGMDQAHEWITGYFEEFPIKKFNIEIGEMGFEPGDAGFYAFIEDGEREIECNLSTAIAFANRIVKVFNRLVADGDNRFVFEDAKISVIKDGE